VDAGRERKFFFPESSVEPGNIGLARYICVVFPESLVVQIKRAGRDRADDRHDNARKDWYHIV
jgi:hypothetical protein